MVPPFSSHSRHFIFQSSYRRHHLIGRHRCLSFNPPKPLLAPPQPQPQPTHTHNRTHYRTNCNRDRNRNHRHIHHFTSVISLLRIAHSSRQLFPNQAGTTLTQFGKGIIREE
jgi:hypothetical protein